MPRPFLIDTDTASDDAVALIMALRSPDVQVAAITVVAGNGAYAGLFRIQAERFRQDTAIRRRDSDAHHQALG